MKKKRHNPVRNTAPELASRYGQYFTPVTLPYLNTATKLDMRVSRGGRSRGGSRQRSRGGGGASREASVVGGVRGGGGEGGGEGEAAAAAATTTVRDRGDAGEKRRGEKSLALDSRSPTSSDLPTATFVNLDDLHRMYNPYYHMTTGYTTTNNNNNNINNNDNSITNYRNNNTIEATSSYPTSRPDYNNSNSLYYNTTGITTTSHNPDSLSPYWIMNHRKDPSGFLRVPMNSPKGSRGPPRVDLGTGRNLGSWKNVRKNREDLSEAKRRGGGGGGFRPDTRGPAPFPERSTPVQIRLLSKRAQQEV
jgi:hypothetical protein